jgi:hypothetical protein
LLCSLPALTSSAVHKKAAELTRSLYEPMRFLGHSTSSSNKVSCSTGTGAFVQVSTLDQNERRQLDGPVRDRVSTDKAPGRDTFRPKLAELLRFARDGDSVVVHSRDRLARTWITCVHWSRL